MATKSEKSGFRNLVLEPETLFATAIVMVCAVYAYFFLILPQSWTLNDDYAFLIHRKEGRLSLNGGFHWLMESMIAEGRFRPLDALTRVWRYVYLPLEPVAFRFIQIFMLGVTLTAFFRLMRNLGMATVQILFALLLALSAFTIKDWILLTAASESLACFFLFLGLAGYSGGRKWLGIIFYFCSFLSKESFFVTGLCFAVLEFIQYRKTRKFDMGPLAFGGVGALTFVGYIASLPRVYTQGRFTGFPVIGFVSSLALPALKCYGPAMLIVAMGLFSSGKNIGLKKRLLDGPFLLGASLILSMTGLLVGWGTFGSWLYLHMAIPFGWALLLASLFQFKTQDFSVPKALALLGVCAFSLFVAVNGSFKNWTFLNNAKVVGDMACEDFKRVPGIRFYTNCNEGAAQLENYLLSSGTCGNVPKFTYVPENQPLPPSTFAPYSVIVGSMCGGLPDLSGDLPSAQVKLWGWTVIKKLN
jgi:hypothetical protein